MVVVVNAADVELTGRKWDQKMYRWHTGYPGGLKERTAKQMFAKQPDSILREAVMGMLPKNNLRRVSQVEPGHGWPGSWLGGRMRGCCANSTRRNGRGAEGLLAQAHS